MTLEDLELGPCQPKPVPSDPSSSRADGLTAKRTATGGQAVQGEMCRTSFRALILGGLSCAFGPQETWAAAGDPSTGEGDRLWERRMFWKHSRAAWGPKAPASCICLLFLLSTPRAPAMQHRLTEKRPPTDLFTCPK